MIDGGINKSAPIIFNSAPNSKPGVETKSKRQSVILPQNNLGADATDIPSKVQ